MRFRLVILLGMSVVVAQAEDDPTDLLRRVSQKVMDTVNRLPKYVCTLSIDRAEYENNGVFQTRACDALASEKRAALVKRRLSRSDRLRLDVAIGTSHELFGTTNEMYSWVGDDHFDNHGLFTLVSQGAISSGSFSTLLVSIFVEDRATFSLTTAILPRTAGCWRNSDSEYRWKRATTSTFMGWGEANMCGLRRRAHF